MWRRYKDTFWYLLNMTGEQFILGTIFLGFKCIYSSSWIQIPYELNLPFLMIKYMVLTKSRDSEVANAILYLPSSTFSILGTLNNSWEVQQLPNKLAKGMSKRVLN